MKLTHLIIEERRQSKIHTLTVRDENYKFLVDYRIGLKSHKRTFLADLHCWAYDYPYIDFIAMAPDQCRSRVALYYGDCGVML